MREALEPCRYSVIENKNQREIVMIRGRGCVWRRCRFCDYHLDSCADDAANFALNRRELAKVTGVYGRLEVINSGSFVELDRETLDLIRNICLAKRIESLHFECHWIHREEASALRRSFEENGIRVTIKTGVETFDIPFRETILDKGFGSAKPEEIARYFEECCLLQGLSGQTVPSMTEDIEIGLKHFRRVCVNIMQENSTPVKPDPAVISAFLHEVYPYYKENPRVDILLENTDFGVGGPNEK